MVVDFNIQDIVDKSLKDLKRLSKKYNYKIKQLNEFQRIQQFKKDMKIIATNSKT